MTERKEWRFHLEWAECGECGSDNVYATHESAVEEIEQPPILGLTCSDCGSEYRHMGQRTVVHWREPRT